MSVIKSLVIAFSMYSKIPMPHLELEEKDMRYLYSKGIDVIITNYPELAKEIKNK